MSAELWSLLTLLLLGAWHGVNPGMGWLFAVALGMQEGRSGAVVRALLPLAAGHGIAIGAAVLVALTLGMAIPTTVLQWIVAGALVALGVHRLVRHRHPRFGGMRVTAGQLTVWSLLMASAHGAGLMVLPVVLGDGGVAADPHGTATHGVHALHGGAADAAAVGLAGLVPGLPPGLVPGLIATAAHTVGYLLVTAVVALLVYRRLGLRLLRTLWVNLDLVWGAALILTGIVTPLL